MPSIADIDGVRIMMYWNDHPPPHFHALFAEHRAVFEIGSLKVVAGDLPRSKIAAVRKWAKSRRERLMATWDRVREGKPVGSLK
jgi:hypothetical protein